MINKAKRLLSYITAVLVVALCAGTFTACKTETVDLVSNMIQLEYTSVVYDGAEKKPSVSIKVDKETISTDEYTVEYSNNKESGTAIVKVVAAEGSKSIKGTVAVGFEILPASATVSTLEAINNTMSNVNYSSVIVDQPFTLNAGEKLTIAEDFVVNFGDNYLTNNGEIINKGTIIINKGISGTGKITEVGEIRAEVSTMYDLQNALSFANTVRLVADIPAAATVGENKFEICSNAKYKEVTIDLNGHTINRQFRIDAKYGSKTVNITNTAENEGVINTNGLVSLPAIICLGNADAANQEVNLNITNVKVVGDEIGNGTYMWAALTTNGLYYGKYFNIYAKNSVFVGGKTSAAYLPARYNYKFVECEFTGATGYYTKSGEHKLIDCTVNGTKNEYSDPLYHDNGCEETGSAMVLDSSESYFQPLKVTVMGGKFNSLKGYAIEEYATSGSGILNYYSELKITKTPTYKFGAGKTALAVPGFVALDVMSNAQDVIDDLFEKVYENTELGEDNDYTFDELAEKVADIQYYIEIGTLSHITEISALQFGETVFTNGQIVEVSIGYDNQLKDKAFFIKNGKLYVSATILVFEAQGIDSIKINGKEFDFNLTNALRRVSVSGVNYRGTGNSAEEVTGKYNEYNLTISAADDYLEIFYANASETDMILTKKVNGDVVRYGMTGVVVETEGNPLGWYPVRYYTDFKDVPRELDNTTTEYSFYVIGKGVATLTFNIDLAELA